MARPSRSQFEQLVREHHIAVHRSALRVCGCSADAADVTQEVFLRVLRGEVRFAAAAGERAALCWLSTRLAANANRARRRRERHEETVMREQPHEAADPAGILAAADLRQHVAHLVAALPAELRLPVQLRCQDELSFAAIGSALDVSESTAHARFHAAVERLRRSLLGRGHAVAAGALPELVAAIPAPPAPPALEARLLTLGKASAWLTAGVTRRAVVLVSAAVVGLTAVVASRTGSGPDGPPRGAGITAAVAARGAVGDESAVQEPPPLPGRRAVPARSPRVAGRTGSPAPSVFTGTVHDAAGAAVAGARVQAVAGGNLKPFELGAASTGDDGTFRLEIEHGNLGGVARYARLRVLEGPALLLITADHELPHAADADPLRLVLPPGAGTAATRYALAVTVRGVDRAPLAGVPVVLYPAVDPRPRPGVGGAEAEARTDAQGVARLEGRLAGEKWLFVDGREHGHVASFASCTVFVGAELQHAVHLARGARLRGAARPVDGAPVEYLSVWLEDDDGLVHHADTAPDGSFAFDGLADRPYTLRAAAHPWSPVLLRAVRPSSRPVTIALKRADDPRDVGHHMAEVHGRLIDAETGETVPWSGFAIDRFRRRDGESSLLTDVVVRPAPVQQSLDDIRAREDFHEIGLEAGRHVLVVRVPGYAHALHEVALRETELVGDLRIPLRRGATVRGRVVGDDRRPLAGVAVFLAGIGAAADANLREIDEHALQPSDWEHWPCVVLCRARTAADGSFTLAAVPPGILLRVVAVAEGYRLAERATGALQPRETAGDVELCLSRR